MKRGVFLGAAFIGRTCGARGDVHRAASIRPASMRPVFMGRHSCARFSWAAFMRPVSMRPVFMGRCPMLEIFQACSLIGGCASKMFQPGHDTSRPRTASSMRSPNIGYRPILALQHGASPHECRPMNADPCLRPRHGGWFMDAPMIAPGIHGAASIRPASMGRHSCVRYPCAPFSWGDAPCWRFFRPVA